MEGWTNLVAFNVIKTWVNGETAQNLDRRCTFLSVILFQKCFRAGLDFLTDCTFCTWRGELRRCDPTAEDVRGHREPHPGYVDG